MDNFHTGFILDSLANYERYTKDKTYNEVFEKGLKYYKKNLFEGNIIPKYYNNSLYPIDIHSCAQAIITLSKFDKETALKITDWTIKNMQKKDGSFIYRVYRTHKLKHSFTRWGQAWMLYALSTIMVKNEL